MKNLKDRMYNYEAPPPAESWQIITSALDKQRDDESMHAKKNKNILYVSLAAAAVIIIIFSLFIRFDNSGKFNETANGINQNKITIPKQDGTDQTLIQTANNPNEIKTGLALKKYITICSPQGEPIKVSSKVASLIVSSDEQYPPNPVWNDKVKKWKDIMKANILAPTTANFLDIVELTHSLEMNNP